MLSKEQVIKLREDLMQSKHEYLGDAYDIWVALMEQVNKILEIETGNGSICGGVPK